MGFMAVLLCGIGIFLIILNVGCLSRVEGSNINKLKKIHKKRHKKRHYSSAKDKCKKYNRYNRFISFFYWLDIIYVLGISLFFRLSPLDDNWFSNAVLSFILLIILVVIEMIMICLIINNILTIEHVIKKSQESNSNKSALKKNDMFFEVIIISTLILIVIVNLVGWFKNIVITKPLIDVLQLVLGSIVLGVIIDELKNGYKTDKRTKFKYICILIILLGAYCCLDNEKENPSTSDIIEQTNKLIEKNKISKKDLKELNHKISTSLKDSTK